MFKSVYEKEKTRNPVMKRKITEEIAIKNRESNREMTLIMRDNYMDDDTLTPEPY
jgi:hypothetical protein